MVEMKVKIVNEDSMEQLSSWFDLPVSYSEVLEKIGLDLSGDNWVEIHDSIFPFELDRYERVDNLNRWAELTRENPDIVKYFDEMIENGWFGSVDEAFEKVGEVTLLTDCTTMTDVAYKYIKECYAELAEFITMYLNYEAIGNDMEIEGDYLLCSDGFYMNLM